MATQAARKKAEEQSLKALRELTSLPHNKKCQECQERGTTYADMTTSGFTCTQCSGYLRGLNPPHRVKSISMTTFNEKELEQLKKGGNEISRLVWLNKWNPKRDRDPDKKDEIAYKEFLIAKYERKQWYRSLSEVKKDGEEGKDSSKTELKPLQPPPSKSERTRNTTSSSPNVTPSHSTTSTTSHPTTTTSGPKNEKFDLLGDLDSDPFTPKRPVGGVSVLPQGPPPLLNQTNASSKPDDFGAFTGAAPAGVQPAGATLTSLSSAQSSASAGNDDRYSALANLDQSLKGVQPNPPPQLQTQPFGGGGPYGPLGAGAIPTQQQSNPFVTGGANAQAMPTGIQVGGGFQGRFPTQGGAMQPYGGQQQQFGGFGQQAGGFVQQRPLQQQQQWGQQQAFGPGVQGTQALWRAQSTAGNVPQQQQQQWGAQTQIGSQQGFGVQGGGVRAQGPGGFGAMQQASQQHQFGGFVSAGPPQIQQQSQFNWGGGSMTPPTQPRGLPTSSASADTQKSTAQLNISSNWSSSLTKPAPSSTWGLQQQPHSSSGTGASSNTTWSSNVLSGPTTSHSSGWWGGGNPSGGGFGQQSASFGQQQTSGFGQQRSVGFSQPAGSGGFGQPTSVGGFGQQAGAGGFGQQAGAGGFGQQASAGGFGQQASAGGFGQLTSVGGFGQQASAGGFGQQAGVGGFGQQASAGGFGQQAGVGGFGQQAGVGGFGHLAGAGGFGQQAGVGGFGQQASAGGFGQQASAGGFGQQASAGGFGQQAGVGGFSQQAGAGGFGQQAGVGGFSQQAGAGGFGQQGGAGGFGQQAGAGGFGQQGGAGQQGSMAQNWGAFSQMTPPQHQQLPPIGGQPQGGNWQLTGAQIPGQLGNQSPSSNPFAPSSKSQTNPFL